MLVWVSMLVGIDEVGRGCWAGPLLVVAAYQKSEAVANLRDSKLLSKKQRTSLYQLLINDYRFGEGWVQPEEIDQFGLTQAMRLGVSRALVALGTDANAEIIIDGNTNYCPQEFVNARCEIKADNLYPIVSAASIYAKVTRDTYMAEISHKYPNYQFEKHVGYGTQLHRDALKLYGVSTLHRKSYRPIRAFLEGAA